MKPPRIILPIIVISQFFCTSLWFAGNGVMNELMTTFDLNESALGDLTSFVQFGFISGTLVFAILSIADRFSPSKVFFVCALLGALSNACVMWQGNSLASILSFRFLTGFFLAGIYPVGMKIAADYFQTGLGKSLGYLVGALVVGTAFPHLLKEISGSFPWEFVLIATSSLAVSGGLLMLILVPDGPYRKASQKLELSAIFGIFRDKEFRSAAFGYFGHMWELYAFWAFVPVMLKIYNDVHPDTPFNIPLYSFLIIGIGGIACVIGGYMAQAFDTKKVANISLLASGICCLLSPLVFSVDSKVVFILFLLFWGMVVIADSPLFSTLVAQNAPQELKGTALTIVNCIGFSVTIISIQLLSYLRLMTESHVIFTVLAIGPLFGLMALMGRSGFLSSKQVQAS
ncbi:MAG: MFS transporter [Bacteroidia bacterium]|nr:MFS transporter [Bacteroidia bacterium]